MEIFCLALDCLLIPFKKKIASSSFRALLELYNVQGCVPEQEPGTDQGQTELKLNYFF